MKKLLLGLTLILAAFVSYSQPILDLTDRATGEKRGIPVAEIRTVNSKDTNAYIVTLDPKQRFYSLESLDTIEARACDYLVRVTDRATAEEFLVSVNYITHVGRDVKNSNKAYIVVKSPTQRLNIDESYTAALAILDDVSCGAGGGGALSDGDYGDITVSGSGGTWNIDASTVGSTEITNGSVANADLADMAQSTFKGRAAAAGTGVPQDLSVAQAKTILAYTAADVANVAAGNIAATNVQTALNELDTEKQVAIQFRDEGIDVGALGLINHLDFVGTGVAATRVADTITVTVSAGGGSISHDALDDPNDTVSVRSYRLGGSATVLTNPGAGEYTLTAQSGAFIQTARLFGNSGVLNGSSEMVIRVDNSANSLDRTFIVQLYDANNNALVDQQATGTNHTQGVSGNTTTITIPGLNGFGTTGFYVELR